MAEIELTSVILTQPPRSRALELQLSLTIPSSIADALISEADRRLSATRDRLRAAVAQLPEATAAREAARRAADAGQKTIEALAHLATAEAALSAFQRGEVSPDADPLALAQRVEDSKKTAQLLGGLLPGLRHQATVAQNALSSAASNVSAQAAHEGLLAAERARETFAAFLERGGSKALAALVGSELDRQGCAVSRSVDSTMILQMPTPTPAA